MYLKTSSSPCKDHKLILKITEEDYLKPDKVSCTSMQHPVLSRQLNQPMECAGCRTREVEIQWNWR
jgi:hypothetical protein